MAQKAAIVSTVRGAGATIGSFIRYHLHIGFARIYLFFDDPQDPGMEHASGFPEVLVTRHDDRLRAAWARTRFYRLRRYDRNGVYLMDRQQLNVAFAIERALQEGIDWLLHIDQDELFYTPAFFRTPSRTVDSVLQDYLDRGICNVNFRNYEAVVEQPDIVDPFRQVTLFKRQPGTLPGGRFAQGQVRQIRAVPQFSERFFFNYANGKSAASVSRELIPDGVHDFFLREQQGWWPGVLRRLALNRLTQRQAARRPAVQRASDKLLAQQRRRCDVTYEPLILHYWNCGFEQFWAKYASFDYYRSFRDQGTLDRISPYHQEAAQVVQDGDQGKAREFYERRTVISDHNLVERLIGSQILCRITDPAEWLAHTT
jgi:hypothetical protein